MATDPAKDGLDPGQGDDTQTDGAGKDNAGAVTSEDRMANLEAHMEMVQEGIAEMRNVVLSNRQPSPSAPAEEVINDDEPLTPSKVAKIVNQAVSKAASANQSLTERSVWDDRAKKEFPLHDPKFMKEFRREFRTAVEGGLNPNHPKAVYHVAQTTARTTGTVRRQAPKEDADTTHTSEAPTPGSRTRQPTRNTSTIQDNDPRLAFYKMKGGKSPEKIEALKKRLEAQDAKVASRRAR